MTSRFVYYNVNPHKIEEEDCVCRAITLASGLPYYTVEKMLALVAEHNDCEKLCVCCYHYLLEQVLGYPVRFCNDTQTVGDIASEYPHNAVLIRINGHLTCAVCGTVYDIWDCRDEYADCFWLVSPR